MKTVIKTLAIGLMLVGVAGLAGCNTVKGFGQDMQKGGQDVQSAAQKNGASGSTTTTRTTYTRNANN